MIITDYLILNAEKYPDEEAIVQIDSNNRRDNITWSKLEFLSNQVANLLLSQNIKKGDKIGILLENSIVWLPIYFGILKAGAVAVPLNYNNSIDEVKYCIEYVDCKCVFVSRHDKCYSFLDRGKRWIYEVDSILELNNLLVDYSRTYKSKTICSEDVASIYFSSGTSGRSKAVLISHASLVSSAQMELSHHSQCVEDRFLCLSPLYHTGAKIHWFGSLVVGGSIVLYNSSMSPKNLIHIIEKEKITITFLLVPQILDILDAIDLGDIVLENYMLTQWRLMHSGAQHIPQSLIYRWREHFPLQAYDTNYGLTEASGPGCIHLGVRNYHKAGAIGQPDPQWEVAIVNNHKLVAKGELGELKIKGPGVMIGYFNDEIATSQVLVDGWLYTGDIAYIDNDDFVYIVDRKSDVIISGGENIYPIQIENYLRKLPNVKDVAVVGVPNIRMGELVAAIVEFKEGEEYTKKQLIDYCSHLPAYQRPCVFVFNKVIRNSVGKIDKKEMKRLYFQN